MGLARVRTNTAKKAMQIEAVAKPASPFIFKTLAPSEETLRMLDASQVACASVDKLILDVEDTSVVRLSEVKLSVNLKEGEMVDGIVCFKGAAGVFIDIGYDQAAFLSGPRHEVVALEPTDELKGLRVEKVDIENVQGIQLVWITVSFACLSDFVAARLPQSLIGVKIGETLEGRVACRSNEGVYVDLGEERLGWVLAPLQEAVKLQANQRVSATVEEVNVEAGIFLVSVAGLPKLKKLKLFEDSWMARWLMAESAPKRHRKKKAVNASALDIHAPRESVRRADPWARRAGAQIHAILDAEK